MDFKIKQKKYFSRVEIKRFLWQTRNKYIQAQEKKILKQALEKPATPLLEVGTGEGANLYNLGLLDVTGIDYSAERIAFAKSHNPDSTFLLAEATALPFAPETFVTVFCRDLLHHLTREDSVKAVGEMVRVLKQSGRLVLIEANRRNSLIFLQGLVMPRERGLLISTPEPLESLLISLGCREVVLEYAEPLPFFRLTFHYRFGLPWLTRIPLVATMTTIFNFIWRIIIPRRYWAYAIIKARK